MNEAKVIWNNGCPYSPKYDDYYFSTDGGFQETQYVFLENNNLPERWKEKPKFVIAETGFGTGLNFVTTLHSWNKLKHEDKYLTYYSIEKNPLNHKDLNQALSLWPELQQEKEALLQVYPKPFFSENNLPLKVFFFKKYQCELILMWGEVFEQLKVLASNLSLFASGHKDQHFKGVDRQLIDTWYLDGFSPSKNPDMWSQPTFEQISNLTAENGTFSTYTAASFVRKGLIKSGFKVKKVAGFGIKREMIRGTLATK